MARRYVPGTNVLETTWATPTGWLLVHDALSVGPWRDRPDDPHTRPPPDLDAERVLIRVAECLQGEVDMNLLCRPAPDYGRGAVAWTLADDRHSATTGGDGDAPDLLVTSDLNLAVEHQRLEARHRMVDGERRFCALAWGAEPAPPESAEEALDRINATSEYWRRWLAAGSFPDHPWRIHLQRSALTLKALSYSPSGAMLAAATTSLPETPRGERNWDYRYCWIRDATFTLWSLHVLGLDAEAEDFARYIGDICFAHGNQLQIMYGIGGERDLTESTLDHLSGYGGARPVRIGNGAFDQRQNDVYGALVDSLYIHAKTNREIPTPIWPIVADQVDTAAKAWREPDQGIWEARGEPKHYVSSKLMCWVALDRGARLAKRHGEWDERGDRWRQIADEVQADILANGVKDGILRQHYDTEALDASTLLAPWSASCRPSTTSSAPRCSRSPTTSPITDWCSATGSRRPTTASRARRAPSRSAPSGSPPRSRRSASPSRRGRCARSCWRSPARSASTARRSSRAAAPTSGTSRRRSRTWP